MKKRILSVALIAVMMLSFTLAGCGSDSLSDGGEKQGGTGRKVGVAMPTQSSERWIKDGSNMKERLEEMGYEFEPERVIDSGHTCVRFVTSWATPQSAVDAFLRDLAACR